VTSDCLPWRHATGQVANSRAMADAIYSNYHETPTITSNKSENSKVREVKVSAFEPAINTLNYS